MKLGPLPAVAVLPAIPALPAPPPLPLLPDLPLAPALVALEPPPPGSPPALTPAAPASEAPPPSLAVGKGHGGWDSQNFSSTITHQLGASEPSASRVGDRARLRGALLERDRPPANGNAARQ